MRIIEYVSIILVISTITLIGTAQENNQYETTNSVNIIEHPGYFENIHVDAYYEIITTCTPNWWGGEYCQSYQIYVPAYDYQIWHDAYTTIETIETP